jgi:hypothetical protein
MRRGYVRAGSRPEGDEAFVRQCSEGCEHYTLVHTELGGQFSRGWKAVTTGESADVETVHDSIPQ